MKRADRIGPGAQFDRHVLQVGQEAFDQRLRLRFGPCLARKTLQARDSSGTFSARPHQLRERVERLRFVAGRGGDGDDRCPSHFRRIGSMKERFNFRIERGAEICIANQWN